MSTYDLFLAILRGDPAFMAAWGPTGYPVENAVQSFAQHVNQALSLYLRNQDYSFYTGPGQIDGSAVETAVRAFAAGQFTTTDLLNLADPGNPAAGVTYDPTTMVSQGSGSTATGPYVTPTITPSGTPAPPATGGGMDWTTTLMYAALGYIALKMLKGL
jgi:hypothetical protein